MSIVAEILEVVSEKEDYVKGQSWVGVVLGQGLGEESIIGRLCIIHQSLTWKNTKPLDRCYSTCNYIFHVLLMRDNKNIVDFGIKFSHIHKKITAVVL